MAKKKMVIYKNGAFHEIAGSGGGGGSGGDAEFDSITLPDHFDLKFSSFHDTFADWSNRVSVLTMALSYLGQAFLGQFYTSYVEIKTSDPTSFSKCSLRMPVDASVAQQFEDTLIDTAEQMTGQEDLDIDTAIQIIQQAWEVMTSEQRRTLAEQALTLSFFGANATLSPLRIQIQRFEGGDRGFATSSSVDSTFNCAKYDLLFNEGAGNYTLVAWGYPASVNLDGEIEFAQSFDYSEMTIFNVVDELISHGNIEFDIYKNWD